jgi:hypothetical protein
MENYGPIFASLISCCVTRAVGVETRIHAVLSDRIPIQKPIFIRKLWLQVRKTLQ